MSGPVYPLAPRSLPLQQAAQRLWAIRYLMREGALDPHATITALDLLARHPDRRIAALANHTACDLADRAASQEQRA